MRNVVKSASGGKKKIVILLLLLVMSFSLREISFAQEKPEMAAVVANIIGTLKVIPAGETKWKFAKPGMFLYEGDELTTDKNSRATIVFANGMETRINENTNFKIETNPEEMKGTGNIVSIKKGQTWSNVYRKGSKFDFRTPTAVASVRGTKKDLKVGALGETTIMVYEGEVEVKNDFGTVTVKENERTTVEAGQAPKPPEQIKSEEKSTWQEEVKTKGNLKLKTDNLTQIAGLPFTIEINVQDSEGKIDTSFDKGIDLSADSVNINFSADGGTTWGIKKVKLSAGSAKILVRDNLAEKVNISVSYPNYTADAVSIQFNLPSKKNLLLKIKTEEDEEKTLKLKFGK